MLSKPDSALVIVGHGSTLNPDSSAPTHEHADAIRARGIFGEVAACFWKEEPSMREVLRMVESRDVYVVPDFISEGYFTRTVIPRELGLDGPRTERDGRTIKYCEPVGSHPRMTDVLLKRARETAPDVPTAEASLVIVGHGTALNDNSAVAAKEQVARIAALECYGEVLAAYMEEPPLIADWDRITRCPNVVVLPFFIADGLHSYQDIPVLLGIEEEGAPAASQREVFRRNPYDVRGRRLYYASAIGTEPLLADVILDQVAAFDAAAGV
jgi:sirohydrochlorin cobaltochelatase